MKLKEIKKYIEIYYKRIAKRRREVEKEEINMLWRVIRVKAKKDKLAKEAKKKPRPKNPIIKKLEYDTDE